MSSHLSGVGNFVFKDVEDERLKDFKPSGGIARNGSGVSMMFGDELDGGA